jgi:hypothetical protein
MIQDVDEDRQGKNLCHLKLEIYGNGNCSNVCHRESLPTGARIRVYIPITPIKASYAPSESKDKVLARTGLELQ